MSDIRAPVACEKCGSSRTDVLQLTVEHRSDRNGKLVPTSLTYVIRCPDCGHAFQHEMPEEAAL